MCQLNFSPSYSSSYLRLRCWWCLCSKGKTAFFLFYWLRTNFLDSEPIYFPWECTDKGWEQVWQKAEVNKSLCWCVSPQRSSEKSVWDVRWNYPKNMLLRLMKSYTNQPWEVIHSSNLEANSCWNISVWPKVEPTDISFYSSALSPRAIAFSLTRLHPQIPDSSLTFRHLV